MPTLTRRDFLATTTAIAATAALTPVALAQPPVPIPQPPLPRRTLRKAVMFGMIQPATEASLTDKFRMLRDAGFEGVEMDSPGKIPLTDIKAAAVKTGIKVHGLVDSVHWRIPLNASSSAARVEAVNAIATCIADARELGATSILLVPAIVNKDLSYEDAYSVTQAVLREQVAPLLKGSGVKVSIENVWNSFLLSPIEAARYIDEINGLKVGGSVKPDVADLPFAFHFDIGNVINFGWPAQWINTLAHRISRLHIKDFSRKKRDAEGLWKGFEVELGGGDADWPATMAALDRIGYSTSTNAGGGNWATAEVRGGDANRLKEISAQMDALFAM